jgi:cytochrome bd-type quinol oxidase subunit 1
MIAGGNWWRANEIVIRPSGAFALEASFFGVLLLGRQRVAPWFYLLSTAMIALGTFSAFWIMVNISWMQARIGYVLEDGAFVATAWGKIIFSPVVWVCFPHMLLASYLTDAFCVAATGAWYFLRGDFQAKARIVLRMGLYPTVILVSLQLGARWVSWVQGGEVEIAVGCCPHVQQNPHRCLLPPSGVARL